MRLSSSTYVAANGTILFFFMTEKYSIVCMCYIFLIHSSVYGHLCCFHVLAIVNNAARNIGVRVSFWMKVLSGYMPRSWIIWQFYIQFPEILLYCFPQWLYQFTFPPTVKEGTLFSTPSPAFVIYDLLMMAILTGVRFDSPQF